MDAKEEQVWKECLALWKAIAEGDYKVSFLKYGIVDFKDLILVSKGYDLKLNGCPMCDAYMDRSFKKSCTGCPISEEFDGEYAACENYKNFVGFRTPYGAWQYKYPDIKGLSEPFYKYLKDLARRRGCKGGNDV